MSTSGSRVVISPYSETWPTVFSGVRAELLSVFDDEPVKVEHIGSTSVTGLAAKPVIDVLLGAQSLSSIELRIEPLTAVGFVYISKYEQELPMRRYFVKAPASSLRVHLHAVELGSRFWCEHLGFRDLLRSDAELRANYQALKVELAQRYSDDKRAYTDAKGPFIRQALRRVAISGDAA